jgi:hypothetical protein
VATLTLIRTRDSRAYEEISRRERAEPSVIGSGQPEPAR